MTNFQITRGQFQSLQKTTVPTYPTPWHRLDGTGDSEIYREYASFNAAMPDMLAYSQWDGTAQIYFATQAGYDRLRG